MGARGGSLLNRDTIVERGEGGIKGNLSRQVDRKRGKGDSFKKLREGAWELRSRNEKNVSEIVLNG